MNFEIGVGTDSRPIIYMLDQYMKDEWPKTWHLDNIQIIRWRLQHSPHSFPKWDHWVTEDGCCSAEKAHNLSPLIPLNSISHAYQAHHIRIQLILKLWVHVSQPFQWITPLYTSQPRWQSPISHGSHGSSWCVVQDGLGGLENCFSSNWMAGSFGKGKYTI